MILKLWKQWRCNETLALAEDCGLRNLCASYCLNVVQKHQGKCQDGIYDDYAVHQGKEKDLDRVQSVHEGRKFNSVAHDLLI